MLEIRAHTPEIGAGVDDQGNVTIHAIDKQQGIILTITVESQYWKKVYENLGRLNGVGIVRATNLIPIKAVQDLEGNDDA